MTKIVAIIPARGGSKGIPQKNIVDLGGYPLIAWSIALARKVDVISDVYVSTDSKKIAQVAKYYGASVPFLRPDYLAGDHSRTVDAIQDFLLRLEEMQEFPDVVVLLQPTQPFRSVESIERAVTLCLKEKAGVVTVSQVREHPILMREISSNKMLTAILKGANSTIRRQDFTKVYKVNGAVYVNFREDYSREHSLNDNPFGIITKDIEGVDIDSLEDLTYAQWLIKRGMVDFPKI